MALPDVGTEAPDFALPSTAGDDVRLRALRGKQVILAFFPLAFTRVCTAELCAFSEDYDRFQSDEAIVLPISVDSIPTLREFKRKENLRVDLLSDFRREVSRAYGVLDEVSFCSRRAYVLVDRDGRVRWVHVETTPGERRANDELLSLLAPAR